MKYFGSCDVGSTYTKAVILDENGKMVADTTIKSKINSEQSAIAAMDEVLKQVGLSSSNHYRYGHKESAGPHTHRPRPTTALYLYAKSALVRTLHRDIISLFLLSRW